MARTGIRRVTTRDPAPDRFDLLLRVKVGERLPQHLLDSIKTAANARDVPYQSLIKVWLQEKLQGS
jgi:predicted DNA binding CopG/RHH family protein